jgi:hypothetical protein
MAGASADPAVHAAASPPARGAARKKRWPGVVGGRVTSCSQRPRTRARRQHWSALAAQLTRRSHRRKARDRARFRNAPSGTSPLATRPDRPRKSLASPLDIDGWGNVVARDGHAQHRDTAGRGRAAARAPPLRGGFHGRGCRRAPPGERGGSAAGAGGGTETARPLGGGSRGRIARARAPSAAGRGAVRGIARGYQGRRSASLPRPAAAAASWGRCRRGARDAAAAARSRSGRRGRAWRPPAQAGGVRRGGAGSPPDIRGGGAGAAGTGVAAARSAEARRRELAPRRA